MANVLYEEASVQAIADAIRLKNGGTDTYTISEMANAILSIETQETDGEIVPSYHYVEALEVAKKIDEFKASHPNHLIFGTISDNHVYANDTTYETLSKASMLHGAFALETVGAMTGCDFVASLGDNCWENGSGTTNAYQGSLYAVNVMKPFHNRLTSFSLVGNHDKNDDTQTIYDLIGQYNDFDVWASTQIRSFGLKDFTSKKVRVICLNTCDYLNASGGCALSYEQKDFLMRSLDLSQKDDASSWQIIILSHIPIDWNGGDYNFYADLQAILNAYVNGTTASITVNSSYALNETPSGYATYSSGKLVYNYAGKNLAKIIANIHGHVHTDAYGRMADNNILRMATPNTCFYLGKTESYPNYGDYSIDTAISRTANTPTDTSATFYCIDLDEQVIYSYAYGGGSDRIATYQDATMYSISYDFTNVTANNNVTAVIEGGSYTSTLTADADCTLETVTVTMGGTDITSSAYSNGKITISNVTGNIVITASAKAEAYSYDVPDVAVAIRQDVSLSSGTLSFASSNPDAIICVTTANSFSYADRESNTVYLMPVPTKANTVEVNYTPDVTCTVRFVGYKASGTTLTQAFDSGRISDFSYTFTKGSADYIAIIMRRTDGSSWAWGFNDASVGVTFNNGVSGESGGGTDTPTYTNVIDTAGTEDNVRLRSGGATGSADGFASGYFSAKGGDVIRVSFPNGSRASIPSNGVYCCTYSDTNGTLVTAYDGSTSAIVLQNMTDTGYEIHIPTSVSCSYARVAGGPAGGHSGWIVTVNEEIA